MNASGRNKKCLFLSYFLTVVRKKDMVIKPVKNVFFNKQKKMYFIGSVFVINHAAYRWAALYLASKWMHIPMSIVQNEK